MEYNNYITSHKGGYVALTWLPNDRGLSIGQISNSPLERNDPDEGSR